MMNWKFWEYEFRQSYVFLRIIGEGARLFADINIYYMTRVYLYMMRVRRVFHF